MKKLFSLLLVLTMASALLCGCGETEQTSASEDEQAQTQTDAAAGDASAEGGAEAEQAEGSSDAAGTGGEAAGEPEQELVVVTGESTPAVTDLYQLSNFTAESGGSYSYLKSTDNDAVICPWETREGCTPVAVRMTIENQGQETVNFLDDLGATIVADSGKTIIASAYQVNPGQTAEDGNTYPSTKAVPLEKGQSTEIWMIANVPNEVFGSGEGLHAYFMLSDGTLYDFDLRAALG